MIQSFTARSHEDMINLGERLGKLITTGISMALKGDLGAGKTTLVQGIAKGLEVPRGYYVNSPTYNIINEYPARVNLCHMDLYRLGSDEELDHIGFDEILESRPVVVVEWPEILDPGRISFDLFLRLEILENFSRKISFQSSGLEGSNLLRNLFDSI